MVIHNEVIHLFLRIISFQYGIVDVWTVKASDKDFPTFQLQPFNNILPCRPVGRGCQGDSGHALKSLGQERQGSVVRPEIVPPLRYAVGLINRKQSDLYRFQ